MTNVISATTDSCRKFSFETALAMIAGAGFKWVELLAASEWKPHLQAEELNKEDANRVVSLIESYGLKPESISGHSDLSTEKGVELLEARMDLAEWMGVRIINTGTGRKIKTEEEKTSLRRNLRKIGDEAKTRGLIIALEPHGFAFGSGQALRPLIEDVGSDAIRINYDTANVIFYSGLRPEEDIQHVAELIAHVHVKDQIGGKEVWNFPAPGQGSVNFDRIFEILRGVGYQGPYSVEIELTFESLTNQSDMGEALKAGYAFMRSRFSCD